MGIRIEKKTVVYDSITGIGIEPEYLGISREELESYIAQHPFPSDPAYPKEYIIADIKSSGVWFLADDVSEEVKDWIVDMLYELM